MVVGGGGGEGGRWGLHFGGGVVMAEMMSVCLSLW